VKEILRSPIARDPPHNGLAPEDPNHWSAATLETLDRHLVRGYLTPRSDNEASPLQLRRTLDKYYYPHLDTSERDKDQVVHKWMLKKEIPLPKMFMVDQLWLWIISQGELLHVFFSPTSLSSSHLKSSHFCS
jgi:hypothetical protein